MFHVWHATSASYTDGSTLPVLGQTASGPPVTVLTHVSTVYNTNHWFFVGTSNECNQFLMTNSLTPNDLHF
jgi:hypothetical protein